MIALFFAKEILEEKPETNENVYLSRNLGNSDTNGNIFQKTFLYGLSSESYKCFKYSKITFHEWG